jgi:hypothetical protein
VDHLVLGVELDQGEERLRREEFCPGARRMRVEAGLTPSDPAPVYRAVLRKISPANTRPPSTPGSMALA